MLFNLFDNELPCKYLFFAWFEICRKLNVNVYILRQIVLRFHEIDRKFVNIIKIVSSLMDTWNWQHGYQFCGIGKIVVFFRFFSTTFYFMNVCICIDFIHTIHFSEPLSFQNSFFKFIFGWYIFFSKKNLTMQYFFIKIIYMVYYNIRTKSGR